MNQAQESSSIIFPGAYWSHKLALPPWEGTTRCESWEAGITREAGWHPGKARSLTGFLWPATILLSLWVSPFAQDSKNASLQRPAANNLQVMAGGRGG